MGFAGGPTGIMGIMNWQPSKKDVTIQALEVQVMELKAASERSEAARRINISEIMNNSNKQVRHMH